MRWHTWRPLSRIHCLGKWQIECSNWPKESSDLESFSRRGKMFCHCKSGFHLLTGQSLQVLKSGLTTFLKQRIICEFKPFIGSVVSQAMKNSKILIFWTPSLPTLPYNTLEKKQETLCTNIAYFWNLRVYQELKNWFFIIFPEN